MAKSADQEAAELATAAAAGFVVGDTQIVVTGPCLNFDLPRLFGGHGEGPSPQVLRDFFRKIQLFLDVQLPSHLDARFDAAFAVAGCIGDRVWTQRGGALPAAAAPDGRVGDNVLGAIWDWPEGVVDQMATECPDDAPAADGRVVVDVGLDPVHHVVCVVKDDAANVFPSGYGSGYSGQSGYSGYPYSGFSAHSGYSAWSGLSGWSGWSAWSGWSGWSSQSGWSAPSGWSGYSAPSGWSGYSSYSGHSAWSSYSGWSGYSAYSSFSGYSGLSGARGTLSGWTGDSWIDIDFNNNIIGHDGTGVGASLLVYDSNNNGILELYFDEEGHYISGAIHYGPA